MNEYMDTNRDHWDEVTAIHVASEFYDLAGFKEHRDSLTPVERAELGDVRGKSLLHLQCHFGMDTISWARHGATVTGIDFSAPAIAQARALAAELGVEARFVQSNIYALPDNLEGQFDIVFTSYGALIWLPDKPAWARVAAHFVKPGGTFYIAEFHPIAGIFGYTADLHITYPYFASEAPVVFEDSGTYTDRTTPIANAKTYEFPFTLGDIVTSLIDAGLQIQFLHEFPFSTYQFLPFTHVAEDGRVRLKQHDGSVPLLFSIKATKPAE
ncbi:MAG: class I SAM-dependent methyltransferase [Dehalococcoidia bacterium]